MGWRVGLDPSLIAYQFWPPAADYNVTGYESAALDTIMPLALNAPDRRRAAHYWRAAERV
ncbi:MAG: hypothetical protein GWO39_12340, partial [Gammaproteobacteria bacterium]|nr:hypothetical protein [Gammaproteobacteria bacterium]NIY33114.1 hypothetical protein [Gammaproteobacteria bacterium]